MVGGRREPEKFADFISRFNIGKAKLRQRCDGGVLTPPPIEIIARRKVAPAFVPQKLFWMDGLARQDDGKSGRETGTPDHKCKRLFGNLAPAAFSCLPRLQHQACSDCSHSRITAL
jgi:hypothetical protein